MGRKGQVTVFIIIGLILLVLVGLFVYFMANKNQQNYNNGQLDSTKVEPVASYVRLCLEKTSKDALLELGQEGRLYSAAYMKSQEEKIAYFYYKGDGFFPTTITIIEEDVSRYIRENIGSCIGDFSFAGYEISQDLNKIKVSTDFNIENMQVFLNYPIRIKVGAQETTITDFTAKVNIKFQPIYKLAQDIYKKTKEDQDWLDISFLNQQQYSIRLLKVTPDTLIYEITDNNSDIDSKEFVYRFAMKYKM